MEAEQARNHVEQYKSIAQAHEQALAELNATYDEYKRSMDASTSQKDVSCGKYLRLRRMLTLINVCCRTILLLYKSECKP